MPSAGKPAAVSGGASAPESGASAPESGAGGTAAASGDPIGEAIDIADVWSGHPVGFDLLTSGQRQYAAFYDQNRALTIASRLLGERTWKLSRLPSQLGWDSHNAVVIALDTDGHLHVAGKPVELQTDGTLIQRYYHQKLGGEGAFRLAPDTLVAEQTIAPPVPYPAELAKPESSACTRFRAESCGRPRENERDLSIRGEVARHSGLRPARQMPAGVTCFRARRNIMSKNAPSLPQVVSRDAWRAAHDALLAKEKELTHARDALAAERRRLPMERVEKQYTFEGPNGPMTLLDLFEGRPQLLLYHFMFAPGVHGWPEAGCPGCSMFMDNLGQFTLTHVAHRDASFAIVSRAPLQNLLTYKKRMAWNAPWVSSANTTFNTDFGITTNEGENHGLSVFVRDGDSIFRTYFTSQRGLETIGTVWSLLDLTPFGRQETWEASPAGRPQSAPYEWWRRHDEY